MKIRFWSSTGYSGFLAGLVRELTQKGFDVELCDLRFIRLWPALSTFCEF